MPPLCWSLSFDKCGKRGNLKKPIEDIPWYDAQTPTNHTPTVKLQHMGWHALAKTDAFDLALKYNPTWRAIEGNVHGILDFSKSSSKDAKASDVVSYSITPQFKQQDRHTRTVNIKKQLTRAQTSKTDNDVSINAELFPLNPKFHVIQQRVRQALISPLRQGPRSFSSKACSNTPRTSELFDRQLHSSSFSSHHGSAGNIHHRKLPTNQNNVDGQDEAQSASSSVASHLDAAPISNKRQQHFVTLPSITVDNDNYFKSQICGSVSMSKQLSRSQLPSTRFFLNLTSEPRLFPKRVNQRLQNKQNLPKMSTTDFDSDFEDGS